MLLLFKYYETKMKPTAHSYKNALIKKIKADAQPAEGDDRQLPDAPIPDYDVKTGNMIKADGGHSSWKPRWFRAFNKADNYKIEYYVAEGGE